MCLCRLDEVESAEKIEFPGKFVPELRLIHTISGSKKDKVPMQDKTFQISKNIFVKGFEFGISMRCGLQAGPRL